MSNTCTDQETNDNLLPSSLDHLHDPVLAEMEVRAYVARDHISALLAEVRRTRRLLEAGERLAEEVRGYFKAGRTYPSWATDQRLVSALATYEEAAK